MAWEVAPFPCIGQFRFLSLNLYRHPKYAAVLLKVKDGAKLLDLGCCVGQDIRKLIFDGAPSEYLYGSDLFLGYLDIGYQLFRDKGSCRARFFAADIFDEDNALKEFKGKFDIIHTGLFFHLFDWKQQVEAAIRTVRLMQDKPGTMLLGSQVGALVPGERRLQMGLQSKQKKAVYLHDAASFEIFWREVENLSGTTWKVTVTATPIPSRTHGTKSDDGKELGNRTFFGPDTTWLR